MVLRPVNTFSLVLALLASGTFSVRAGYAQAPVPNGPSQPPVTGPAPAPMAEMMKKHQQMLDELNASDNRLDQLVSAMKAAKRPNDQIATITRLATELASQLKSIHSHMESMSSIMMGGRGMMMDGRGAPSK